ncbi:MAG: hypothetical protein KDB22_18390 [Planctomycetales bacterium]|nr:hypothetical protein [Planctomycetales bacterium]
MLPSSFPQTLADLVTHSLRLPTDKFDRNELNLSKQSPALYIQAKHFFCVGNPDSVLARCTSERVVVYAGSYTARIQLRCPGRAGHYCASLILYQVKNKAVTRLCIALDSDADWTTAALLEITSDPLLDTLSPARGHVWSVPVSISRRTLGVLFQTLGKRPETCPLHHWQPIVRTKFDLATQNPQEIGAVPFLRRPAPQSDFACDWQFRMATRFNDNEI